jgi:amino acid transporter
VQTLKSGVVGLAGAATLGVVMLSPAMTLYGNFGASFATAGHAAPLAFIWALLATLPTATSYALLSRERPAAGSAAAWTAQALSTQAGRWVGWMVVLY